MYNLVEVLELFLHLFVEQFRPAKPISFDFRSFVQFGTYNNLVELVALMQCTEHVDFFISFFSLKCVKVSRMTKIKLLCLRPISKEFQYGHLLGFIYLLHKIHAN